MKKPRKHCVNHADRPVQPPSWVLCAECLTKLSAKMFELGRQMGAVPRERPEEPNRG